MKYPNLSSTYFILIGKSLKPEIQHSDIVTQLF